MYRIFAATVLDHRTTRTITYSAGPRRSAAWSVAYWPSPTLDDVLRCLSHEADAGLFAHSATAAVVIGVLGGTALSALGAAIATNWRGWAERYSTAIDHMVPTRRNDWRTTGRPRFLLTNRLIFGVFALFGIGLLIGGVVSLTH